MTDASLCFSVRWAGSNKPIASRLVFSSLKYKRLLVVGRHVCLSKAPSSLRLELLNHPQKSVTWQVVGLAVVAPTPPITQERCKSQANSVDVKRRKCSTSPHTRPPFIDASQVLQRCATYFGCRYFESELKPTNATTTTAHM